MQIYVIPSFRNYFNSYSHDLLDFVLVVQLFSHWLNSEVKFDKNIKMHEKKQ